MRYVTVSPDFFGVDQTINAFNILIDVYVVKIPFLGKKFKQLHHRIFFIFSYWQSQDPTFLIPNHTI
jgi:hypothetical protein